MGITTMSEPFGFSPQSFGQIVEVVLEHGFEAPLYLTAVAANGHMMHVKFESFVGRGGLEASLLATHGDSFTLPINIMIIDTNGEVANAMIGGEGQAPRFMFNGDM